jgi:UDP-hydrolysing UDP-N-acetyl-D-glucosamine 2-epimerase
MRVVGVVTVARSDYGIYLPILRKIQADAEELRLRLIVSGMHLAPEFGRTIEVIEEDGFEIAERVEMLVASDTPEAIGKSMGLGAIGFAQAYARLRPDILLVLGDRFEMHAAALAALPFKIPVAHIHGGELTMGAIDDALRHSMTKLSHLHFVSTDEYARRIVQLGEEPWRVTVSGAPSLDNLHETKLLSVAALESRFGLRLDEPPLLVTYHPVTLEHEQTGQQMSEFLAALQEFEMPIIFTAPNADTGGRIVMQRIKDYVEAHASAQLVNNLGTQAYFSLMATSAAMVGNSSSGIIEAAAFKLPVVNIGNRQEGRVRGANVIDVGYRREEIIEGIRKALDTDFRASLSAMANPYGVGAAADQIVARLKEVPLDHHLLVKRFHDIKVDSSTERGAVV